MKIQSLAALLAVGTLAGLGASPDVHAAALSGRTATAKVAPSPTRFAAGGVDLAVGLEASPWDPEVSIELVYTVTVENLGPVASSEATVRGSLADHLAWSDGADGCQPVTGAVVCTLEPLAAGEIRKLWFALEVLEPYPAEMVEEVRLTAVDPYPVTKNNFAEVRTILDVEAPRVEMVRARFDDSAVRLRQCTQLRTAPGRLEVTFDEEMASGKLSGLVDSVDSYLVVRPGPDGEFDGRSCAALRESAPVPGDLYVRILGVDWDAERRVAELEIDPASAAAAGSGPWRLIVCGGVTDLVGNRLDGDWDGRGGDDAVVNFRVDEGNLIGNGHFDCNVDFWIPAGTDPETFWLGEDALDESQSASGGLESDGGPFAIGAGQCVVEPAPGSYELSAMYRITATESDDDIAPAIFAWAGIVCSSFESTTCDGATQLVDGATTPAVPVPTVGLWNKLSTRIEIPEGTGSVLCTVAASGESEAVDFEFDRVRLVPADDSGLELGGEPTTIRRKR